MVKSGEDLLALLRLGKSRRATAATDVNGGSSRSHAVCQLILDCPSDAQGAPGGMGEELEPSASEGNSSASHYGLLTLVDCAGSERKEDSIYHSKERQRESTEINASLYALKECVRARALKLRGKVVKVPFRTSNLTKVLMESLVRPDAHLAVIGTVRTLSRLPSRLPSFPSPRDTTPTHNTRLHDCRLIIYCSWMIVGDG